LTGRERNSYNEGVKLKSRFSIPVLLILVLLLAFGGFTLLREVWAAHRFKIAPIRQGAATPGRYHDYRGIIHCHSTLSDGSLPVPAIAAIARSIGMDFLVMTDHDYETGKNTGEEGVRDGLLVLAGSEISNLDGHYLSLGVPDTIYRVGGYAREAVEDVRELGGFGIAAHPDNPISPWCDFSIPGIQAIEIRNGDSTWRRESRLSLLRLSLSYFVNPDYAVLKLLSRPDGALGIWDRLNRTGHVTGTAGADAHGCIPVGKRKLKVLGYREVFRAFVNHILTEEPFNGGLAHDKAVLLDALRAGHLYVSVDSLGDPTGFVFQGESGSRTVIQGDSVDGEAITLDVGVEADFPVEARLLRNGQTIRTEQSPEAKRFSFHTEQRGIYRVEVYRNDPSLPRFVKDIPWILSNPIRFNLPPVPRVSEGEEAGVAGPPRLLVGDFEGDAFPSPYTAEYDSRSSVVLSRTVEETTAAGKGAIAAAVRFTLGKPDERHKAVYCAFCDWTKRDLSAYSGVSFFVRSDRVYKMEFQLRDEEPEGEPEKTETWLKTFKTYPERRLVRIPFKDLVRFPQKGTNKVLEPENTAGYFFVLRKDLVKPGTSGTIFLDSIGFY
jgi:hypothetical protein